MEAQYRIQGMKCTSCAAKIKEALKEVVDSVEVTLVPPVLRIGSPNLPSLDSLNDRLSSVGDYHLFPFEKENKSETPLPQEPQETRSWGAIYYPLFLIVTYITAVSFVSTLTEGGLNIHHWMNHFMAGFFIVFSAFKMLDIKGFAEAYATYDLLAQKWRPYGFIYPFLELALGILYLLPSIPSWVHIATIVLMGFSSLGVMRTLARKQQVRCACLGTVLNLPMSSITIVEDLAMVVMAIAGLL